MLISQDLNKARARRKFSWSQAPYYKQLFGPATCPPSHSSFILLHLSSSTGDPSTQPKAPAFAKQDEAGEDVADQENKLIEALLDQVFPRGISFVMAPAARPFYVYVPKGKL